MVSVQCVPVGLPVKWNVHPFQRADDLRRRGRRGERSW
jgi:hypothetical protein